MNDGQQQQEKFGSLFLCRLYSMPLEGAAEALIGFKSWIAL
jgi:hypothetical protein